MGAASAGDGAEHDVATLTSPQAIVDAASEFVADGMPTDEAGRTLAREVGCRTTLQVAHWYWTDRMHRTRSDDFHAGSVLRVLLAALGHVPPASTPA